MVMLVIDACYHFWYTFKHIDSENVANRIVRYTHIVDHVNLSIFSKVYSKSCLLIYKRPFSIGTVCHTNESLSVMTLFVDKGLPKLGCGWCHTSPTFAEAIGIILASW